MQKRITKLALSLPLLLAAAAPAQPSENPQQYAYWLQVQEADRLFAERAAAIGRDLAMQEFLGRGAVAFRQGPVDALGLYTVASENLSEQSEPEDSGTVLWHPHYIDVSRDGDLGISAGPYVMFGESDDTEDDAYGHLLSLWRRQDGQWMLMAELSVPIPGYLSLQVEPDYTHTLRVFAEVAAPLMASSESNTMGRLISADELYARAVSFRGGQRALLRYGLENIRVYLPGMAPAVGMMAASSVYGAFLDSHLQTINPVQLQYQGGYLATSQEMGYTYGVMSTPVADGERGFRTNYLRLWRLTANNEWKIAVEVLSPY